MIKENLSQSSIVPIEKIVEVSLTVEEAFKLFTEGIHTWWPLDASHSVFRYDVESCTFEGKVGGRVYETRKDGTQSIWGTVQAYEPPHLFSTTWHPGNPSELATYLEVRFTETDNGTTVTLTHGGWEVRGEEAQKYRNGYNTGWDFVLGEYIKKATS
jgi:uncharacterized protein YndB with AHSA1/START domain